jgi:MFS family permease
MFFFHRRKRKLFNKSLKILNVTNGLVLVAGAMLGPIAAIFVEDIGGNLMEASLTGAIFALSAGLTVLVSGRYADKHKNPKAVMVFGYAVMTLGFFSLIFVSSIWSLFLVQALIGFGEAIYSPAFNAIYSQHLDHHKEASQWSFWESMNYFTYVAGATLGGLLASTFGFDVLFVAMAVLCAFSVLYLFTIPKKLL